ncbi:peptidase S8/S53 domain-containing protein [Fusarium oxysporum f. sp. albedinis]|nr:peptidase S8/S53 domain-containing protein [Fusarium oxysporum f. sp. albedinis]
MLTRDSAPTNQGHELHITDLNQQVRETNYRETLSRLLTEITSNLLSLKQLGMFSIEVIDRMENYEPVIYFLNALLNGFSENLAFSTIGVLRQLAIQCLQTLTTPKTLGFLAKMNLDFRSAMESDWYRLLAELIKFQQQVTIVLEVGVLRNKFREADTWAAGFLTLIQRLQGKTSVRVIILTGRPINADDNSIVKRMTVGSVPTNSLSHMATRHLMGSTVEQRSPQNAPTGYRGPSLTSSILEGLGPPSASKPVTEIASSTKVTSSKLQHSKDPSGEELSNTDNTSMYSLADSLHKSLGADQASASHSRFVNKSRSTTPLRSSRLETTSHEFMYKDVFQSEVPVKIAVLDTGFAYTNTKDKRGDSDAEAKIDPAGYGTAVAVQILRVSLKVILYICRVVSLNSGPDKLAVQKAIRKAAAKPDKDSPDGGGWGVDIINMSFGWPYHHKGNGVYLFAATSNDGLLGRLNDILYLARSESVIAVNAADGYGDHAKSAPLLTSQHSRGSRFSAPGLGITSPNSKEILEGSSFACPIVAGVTAPSIQRYLQEMPAMLALLRSASSEKGPNGLKFLTP